MPLVSIDPWLGSELAIVADSGLWIGHCFALAAGNRYKGESRNTAILQSTKNAPVPKNRGMKFEYRDSPEYPGTYTLCGGCSGSKEIFAPSVVTVRIPNDWYLYAH